MDGKCNPGMTLPISTAPAVEPAMIDRKALGFYFVRSSDHGILFGNVPDLWFLL